VDEIFEIRAEAGIENGSCGREVDDALVIAKSSGHGIGNVVGRAGLLGSGEDGRAGPIQDSCDGGSVLAGCDGDDRDERQGQAGPHSKRVSGHDRIRFHWHEMLE
jgi:hypothetical protein